VEYLDATEYATAFVQEDVGGGPVKRFPCYNVGEPQEGCHLIDDIGWVFPHEAIWSGSSSNAKRFAGGLEPDDSCPGKIGAQLAMPKLLQDVLK
jgi:hypothetical protein